MWANFSIALDRKMSHVTRVYVTNCFKDFSCQYMQLFNLFGCSLVFHQETPKFVKITIQYKLQTMFMQLFQTCPLRKYCTCGYCMPKQHFIAMIACDSTLPVVILWRVMSMKFNITKKIAGLEIMTLNHEKNVACLQPYRTNV